MAERIGNLIGHLEFTDDQLQRTDKGLKDSGVAMPNFGNVGRELAKEINEEPEEEVETDEESKKDFLNLKHVSKFSNLIRERSATFREREFDYCHTSYC